MDIKRIFLFLLAFILYLIQETTAARFGRYGARVRYYYARYYTYTYYNYYDDSDLSVWAIVGIVIGSIVAFVVFLFCCICCCTLCFGTTNRNTQSSQPNVSTVSGSVTEFTPRSQYSNVQFTSVTENVNMQKLSDMPPSYLEATGQCTNQAYIPDNQHGQS